MYFRGLLTDCSGINFSLTLECTGDQHFVFAIRYDSAAIPVDPTKLIIPGNTNCKPVIVNDKVAIFKFGVTECGARSYVSLSSSLPFIFSNFCALC